MAIESFYFEYEPVYFSLPKLVNDEMVDIIYENLMQINTVEDILGLTMIRFDGKQPLIFSADEAKFAYLKTLGEIISSMGPASYFKDLSRNFEYKGIGHLDFDDFDLFLVTITNNLLLTIMATASTNQVFKISQNFSDQLYKIFNTKGKSENNETVATFARFNTNDDHKKPKKEKTHSKSDLKKLLRHKLDDMDPK
jgi:hypothetical protein